jgi:microsomal dipeptidase-like Zn-dependent dipeptidase
MKVPIRLAPVVFLSALTVMLMSERHAIAQIIKQPPVFKKPAATFANILVTVQGPNTVKIEWYPLPGADLYRVYRTAYQPAATVKIGPDYPSATDATNWNTVYDYNAPAGSALTYYVTASHKTTQHGLPGTPGAGATFTVETLMATSNSIAVTTPALPAVPVWGFADLHAHPATFLAFGADAQGDADYALTQNNGIIWGKTGLGLAAASNDAAVAANLPACSSDSHSGSDADAIRHGIHVQLLQTVVQQTGYPHGSGGYPVFNNWPAAQDLLHQAMYITEIRRAYEGGLRMMFASTTDNEIIYDLWHIGSNVAGNPVPTPTPLFDYNSAIRQINLIQQIVNANSDWMQIVTSSSDARQAIQNDKLAVVVSVEMDALTIDQMLDLIQNHQARHFIPIHLSNNPMGGMALYGDAFNTNTYFHTGNFYSIRTDPCVNFMLGKPSALAQDPTFGQLGAISPQPISDAWFNSLNYLSAWHGGGERNALGLAQPEQFVQLMQKGVMLDIAHMSEQSATDALLLAEKYQYPLVDSHTGLRDDSTCYPTVPAGTSERGIPYSQVKRVAALGGVLGLGTADNSGPDPVALWLQNYKTARALMGGKGVALGTDFNGLSPQIVANAYNIRTPYPIMIGTQLNPPAGATVNALDKFMLGNRTFDFTTDGLANYGLLPDFLEAVYIHPAPTWTPAAGPPPDSNPDAIPELTALFHSAEDVIDMWAKDEQAAANIPNPETVQCSVFDDGNSNIAGPSSVIMINNNLQACVPNANGWDCRKWFGSCTTSASNTPVTFSTFDDGYANPTAGSGAIFIQSVNGTSESCIPGGSNGICHKWFGRGMTQDGRKVLCDLTGDNVNDFVGPTDAIYPYHLPSSATNATNQIESMNQLCLPDGTPTGTCRAKFGHCFVAVE